MFTIKSFDYDIPKFAAGTFAGVSIWQYENIYSHPKKFNSEWFKSKIVQQKNDVSW